jgi:ABC-type antimicrobial peptide transport system permease subunit
LSALPGVQAVGTISSAPLTGAWSFDEKAQILGENLPEADRQVVTARFAAFNYFQAMGIALVEGRLFRDSELKDSGYGQIVVLNESAAAALFPGRSAVGGKFTVGSNPDRVLEVIGVVKDTRDLRLEMKPRPMFYWQYAFGGAQLVIRSSVSERALAPMVRETIRQADSRILGQSIRTMNGVVSKSVAERRFLMSMLAVYAAVALVIATVGVAGVISCQVAQRTNEFGVRLALGSSRGQLLRLVLLQTGRLVAAGVFLGAILSLASNRLLESQLYEISPGNPWLLLLAGSLIVLAALAASVPPARRAAAVDPNTALRYE